jgi:uncharacterized protein (TIGR03435 family)
MAFRFFIVCALLAPVKFVIAQPLEKFEVASIRPSDFKPGEPAHVEYDSFPGSRLVIQNLSLRSIVLSAYNLSQDRFLSGAPSWFQNRYNIQAKGSSPRELTDSEFKPALRALLEERLHLKYHLETREVPAFSLVVAQGGPKVTRSAPGARWAGARWRSRTSVSAEAITMALFAKLMSSKPELENRIVIDNTGLAGNFDIELKWRPESLDGTSSSLAEWPSIFEALEKLGLKLVGTKAPQSILVIDHVEPPTAN